MTFAERVRRLRLAQALTQAELAERVGATPAEVSRWERGHRRPQVRKLRRLCDALGVDAATLLGQTEE